MHCEETIGCTLLFRVFFFFLSANKSDTKDKRFSKHLYIFLKFAAFYVFFRPVSFCTHNAVRRGRRHTVGVLRTRNVTVVVRNERNNTNYDNNLPKNCGRLLRHPSSMIKNQRWKIGGKNRRQHVNPHGRGRFRFSFSRRPSPPGPAAATSQSSLLL